MERPTRVRAQAIARARAGETNSAPEMLRLLNSETNSLWRSVAANLLRHWGGDPKVTRCSRCPRRSKGVTVAAEAVEIVRGFPTTSARAPDGTELGRDPLREGRVQGGRDVGSRLPEASGDPGGRGLQGRLGGAARDDRQDDLLRLAGRDPPAPGRRAVRIRRHHRPDGLDRRSPAVQGVPGAAGWAQARDRRSDSAQGGDRDPPRHRDARGALRDRNPRRELRPQGGRRGAIGEADRRAVSSATTR